LGVDTLSYHCRLVTGAITLDAVLRECAELGYDFVQYNTVHLASYDDEGLAELKRTTDELGLGVTLAGSVLGRRYEGDTVDDAVARVDEWMSVAAKVGSDYVRVSSGFYRTEMGRDLGPIVAEQEYVTESLRAIVDRLGDRGIKILLENHSDFLPEEYLAIVRGVDSPLFEVFLDLINPVAMLREPAPVVALLLPHASAGHIKDYRFESHYVEDGYHRRGFSVNYCYPGEGVADIAGLVGQIAADPRQGTYRLSVEGLDNYADVADQRDRLGATIALLRSLS
jgi:sugar phosphate isomerase/epimerase